MSSSDAGKVKTCLKDFGYAFNEAGQLRQLDDDGNVSDKPFNFQISSSQSENQRNYEAIGEVITDEVYKLLDDHGMFRINVPVGETDPLKCTFVFSTKQELVDVDKLMIVIHGSGVVRAGQWARSLIINHSIDSGTVLPYIKKAQERGYDVIVTNTNDNRRDGKRIEQSGSPEEHANTVWEKIIQPSNAKSIAVVAHSYGGIVTTELAGKYKEDFDQKVFAVALTDSVHGSRDVTSRLREIGINFVGSNDPVGKDQRSYDGDIKRVSAGHPKHEYTSWACIESLFEFVDEKYGKFTNAQVPGSPPTKKTKSEDEL